MFSCRFDFGCSFDCAFGAGVLVVCGVGWFGAIGCLGVGCVAWWVLVCWFGLNGFGWGGLVVLGLVCFSGFVAISWELLIFDAV